MRGDGSRTGGWGRFFATWLQLGGGGGGGDSAGFEEFLSRSGRSEEQKGGAEDDDAQFCGCEEGWNARSAGANGVADDGAEEAPEATRARALAPTMAKATHGAMPRTVPHAIARMDTRVNPKK